MNQAKQNTTSALAALFEGSQPRNGNSPLKCGEWADHIKSLSDALENGQQPFENALEALCHDQRFAELVAEAQSEQSEQSELCTLEYQRFPTEVLPDPVADYATANSAALNVNPAMVAVPCLPVLATAIGNTRRVQLKRSWTEAATIWTAVVGRSGTLKSPSFNASMRPVYSLQTELEEEYQLRRDEYEALDEEAQQQAEEPVRVRLRVGDTTVESVALVHNANVRGLLLARDELGALLGSMNSYKQGESDLQSWIEMYEGTPLVIDRKSSSPPVLHISKPAISIAGGIQPGVLQRKLEEEHFASGFAARFMMAMPPEKPRRWTDADVSRETQRAYDDLIRDLYGIEFNGESEDLPLSSAAKKVFAGFVNSNADLQSKLPGGPLRSLLSKIEAVAARLALIFEVSDDPSAQEVGTGATKRGVRLAKWFRFESARIYQRFEFEKQSKSRDERLAADLPETFGWRKVSDMWEVGKRGAYKVLKRLQKKKLVEDGGHGKYRRTAKGTVHFVHFGHFQGTTGGGDDE